MNIIAFYEEFSSCMKFNVKGWFNKYVGICKDTDTIPLTFSQWLDGYSEYPETLKSMSFDNSWSSK